jgi:integrase/recombinase XerD
VAFPSVRGTPLSRDGVDYLLKQTVQRAVAACPSLATKSISPHVLRHNPESRIMLSHSAK